MSLKVLRTDIVDDFTFLESSFIDWTVDWLESCVSEMMKGSDPASNTLWIFPESVGTAHQQQFEMLYFGVIMQAIFLAHSSWQSL